VADAAAVLQVAPLSSPVERWRPRIRHMAYKRLATWPMCLPSCTPHTSPKEQHLKGRVRKMQERKAAGAHSLRCPFCEVHEREPSGQDSARCPSCQVSLSGALLETLLQITALPLAAGRHAWT
jgi:hypothetical protein